MKILFYLSRFPGWGGIETVTEILGNELVHRGFELSILTHMRQDCPSELVNKVQYYLMPDEGAWHTPANVEFAKNLVQAHHFDFIVYQDSYAPTEGIVTQMKQPGTKLIVCEHNTPLYKQKLLHASPGASFLQELYRRVYSWPRQLKEDRRRHSLLLRASDSYVLLSSGFVDELMAVCGRRRSFSQRNKIRFIHNPAPKSIAADESMKENTILFVGQVNHQKRVGLMLDAWKLLAERFKDWIFTIVGDGPLLEAIAHRVHNEGIERLELCGYRKPLEYYRRAKLFWMTSAYEGWGMTLVEAMQQGVVPVAMHTYSSLSDIIDHEKNGFVSPADDLLSFADYSARLMQDDNLRKRMGVSAKEKASSFAVDHIIPDWLALFGR